MSALEATEFKLWLQQFLQSLGADDELMSSYVLGILEGEGETSEEKESALEGLLEEISPEKGKKLSLEILLKYSVFSGGDSRAAEQSSSRHGTKSGKESESALSEELSRLLHVHHEELLHQAEEERAAAKGGKDGEEETERRELKAAILKQYAEMEERESDGEDSIGEGERQCDCGEDLVKPDNAGIVQAEEKRRREEQKKEAQEKKEKDKADREKQKSMAAERKDKEKKRTQKGEKRSR